MFSFPQQMLAGSMITSAMIAEMSARTFSSVTSLWADALRGSGNTSSGNTGEMRALTVDASPMPQTTDTWTSNRPTHETSAIAGPVGPLPG